MPQNKFWTFVALAGLMAITLVQPERDVDAQLGLAPPRTRPPRDGIASGHSSISTPSSVAASPNAELAMDSV